MTHYFAVVALLTGIVASPFAIAIVLALKSPSKRPNVATTNGAVGGSCHFLGEWFGDPELPAGWDVAGVPFKGWFWSGLLPPVSHLARSTCHALSRTDNTCWEVPVLPDCQEYQNTRESDIRTNAEQTMSRSSIAPGESPARRGVVLDQSLDRRLFRREDLIPPA